jgi:Zn-dependent protease with chaperone function
MWIRVAAAAAALGPGLLAWWWGRRLLPDDPALPERLQSYRERLTWAGLVAGVVAGFVASIGAASLLWWFLPILTGGLLVGNFPHRRRVYEETWGFPAYLSHAARAAIALAGFWLLLATAPLIVDAAGRARWPAAVALAALLFGWSAGYAAVFFRLVRAAPLDRPDLDARFAPVLAGASVAPPRLYRAGPREGRWVNAFGFASAPSSAVVFPETLLQRFDADELAAILAHEVAHLEHYSRRTLARLQRAMWAAIALGTLGVPLLMAWAGDGSLPGRWGGWAWLVLVVLTVGALQGRNQAHESESDRRAVALCGDPEALVRALVKLHGLARLPRRWDAATERIASHPSLARRIRAIRGPVPGAPAGPRVLASSTPGTFVVLEAERIHWLRGVPPGTPAEPHVLLDRAASRDAVACAELVELRVRASLGGRARLVAADRTGRSWGVPLTPDTVEAAQAALDTVDVPPRKGPSGLRRPIVAIGLAVLAMPLGYVAPSIGATFPALIAVATVRPGPPLLAGVGMTALASAAVALLERRDALAAPLPLGAIAGLAVLGLGALGIAWARVRAGERHDRLGALLTVGALGLGAVPVWWSALAMAAVQSATPLALHEAARLLPGAAVAPLATAAALLTLGPGWTRWVALAATALAVAIPATGSTWFVDRFASDPLLGRSPGLAWRDGAARVLRQARLEGRARDLRLAPSGLAFAARGQSEDDDAPGRFHVGRFPGGVRQVEAVDLRFLADDRLLVLTRAGPGAVLRVVRADGGAPDPWRRELPGLVAWDLLADAAGGAWRVAGYDPGGRALVVVAGTVGRDDTVERRWTIPEPEDLEDPGYLAGRRVLLERRASRPPLPAPIGWLLGRLGLGDRGAMQWEVWRHDAGGDRRLLASALHFACDPPRLPAEAFTCLAYDRGVRTLVWALDAETGALSPLGVLPAGVLTATALGPGGRVAARTLQGEILLLEPASRDAVRFALPGGSGRVTGLALEDGGLGVLARHGGGSTITVYEIP